MNNQGLLALAQLILPSEILTNFEVVRVEEEAKCLGESYTPIVLANGDTHKQLLARSRYLLFKSADKWPESQRQRTEVLFETYPDLKEAYSLTHSLRMIFSKNTVKDAVRLSLARWYNKVETLALRVSMLLPPRFTSIMMKS